MKKLSLLIAGFFLGLPGRTVADTIKLDPPPKVEESTRDADKAAAHEASSEADQWAVKNARAEAAKATAAKAAEAAKQAAAPTTAAPPATTAPVTSAPETAKPAPPEPVKAPETAAPPRKGLNEMKGKLQSKSEDPKTLRVAVDGGFNVEFTYDSQTALANGGSKISIDDLEYNDEITVRYAGKDLYAVEIERLRKAPRPQ